VTYVEIESDYGHDAFLLEVDKLAALTRDFLKHVENGLTSGHRRSSGDQEQAAEALMALK
jgi:hypothetical protein